MTERWAHCRAGQEGRDHEGGGGLGGESREDESREVVVLRGDEWGSGTSREQKENERTRSSGRGRGRRSREGGDVEVEQQEGKQARRNSQ